MPGTIARNCLIVLLLAVSRGAATITGISVDGSTNVQTILRYQTDSAGACTVEISESLRLNPLVHDVNPALFPGANSDSRAGAVVSADGRVFAAGKRSVELATDGKWYSRALQVDTVHYFRIRCGADTANGSFRTAPLPAGTASPWPIPQDPATGQFRWPSTDNANRAQTIIDPNYGTLIRRVSVPRDEPGEAEPQSRGRNFLAASGVNWEDPAGALLPDVAGATHSVAGRDWLVLTQSNLANGAYYEAAEAADFIVVRIRGIAPSDDPQERAIEVCLTFDGATCRSEVRSVTLDQKLSVKAVGTPAPVDTWGTPVWHAEISRNPKFGVMIRKRAGAAAVIGIESVEFDAGLSGVASMPEAGNFRLCAPVASSGGFHCATPGKNGSDGNHLFWIHPGSGEVRWLGKAVARGWGGNDAVCLSPFAMWDAADPNIYYCQAAVNGKPVLLRGVYTGRDRQAAPGSYAPFDWTNITPEPSTLGDLVKAFAPAYDPATYPCRASSIAGQFVILECRAGNQDSIGWLAALDVGAGDVRRRPPPRVAAAVNTTAQPRTRWCGLHAVEPLGDIPWIGWTTSLLTGGSRGLGPYTVTLPAGMPASEGRLTIRVSGEPQPFLMNAMPGDLFRTGAGGFDLVRLVQKNSPTEWLVDRKVSFGTLSSRPAGETLAAFCGAQLFESPELSGLGYWGFVADPTGSDSSGATYGAERVLRGAHSAQKGSYRVIAGYSYVAGSLPESWNRPVTGTISANPPVNGVRAWAGLNTDGLGNTYQQHPSYENYAAAAADRRNWFADILPFIGDPRLLSSLTPVPGSTQTWFANGVRLQRDRFPTFAHCGGRQLRDLSPGPIGDADAYSYCTGARCAAGAAASSVVLNCPAPVSAASRCSADFLGDAASVCVADLAPYGQTVSQFFFDDRIPAQARVLTNGLLPWHSPRVPMSLATASPLPDGSWILFASAANNARTDLYMVKVPAAPPADGVDLSQPVLVALTAPDVPSGTATAALEYGNSAALGATLNLSCAMGAPCTATVRVRPLDLLYSRFVFRDARGGVLRQTATQVQLTSGRSGSGVARPSIRAAFNAVDANQQLSPGSIVSLYGSSLADCLAAPDSPPLPYSLCNAAVTMNGLPAPLYFASNDQINARLPAALTPGADVTISASRAADVSDGFVLPGGALLAVAPAILSYSESSGARPLLQTPDGAWNGPGRPLMPGETATVYASGLGPTSPLVADGDAAPADPVARALLPVGVYVNDTPQSVLSAGLLAGSVGTYQVSFVYDAPAASDRAQIAIEAGGVRSPKLPLSVSAP